MNNDLPLNSNTDSQSLLNLIVLDYMKEKKRRRRWRWGLRIVFVILLLVGVYELFIAGDNDKGSNSKEHVGIVDMVGEISESKANADNFAKSLSNAYKNTGLKALVIRINSPGGSPVQAEYMYNTLQFYKKKHPEVKVYSVCVDLCASAAYYVAVAADQVYASPSSLVGSIGVVYNGFGFVDLMNKVGVSRRLETAGANKGFMDPFSPASDAQSQKLQVMLNIIHQQFINRVKEGRGSRLKINDDTFSGLFWTGEQALTMGLIDGFASTGQLARDIMKIDEMVDYTYKQNLFDRMSKGIGSAMAEQLPESLGLNQGLRM